MKLFDLKENCCGCSACYNICPVNAISMTEDKEGFEYPCINNEVCVECGMCKQVCCFNNYYDKCDLEKPFVYALKHNNTEIRKISRSGGAFMAFAEYIIKNNGVVYGVTLDENLIPKHIRVTEIDSLYKLQGSKYVEAEIGDSFKCIYNDLKQGKTVLFASTACKVAGLKSYIKNKKLLENLITIDLVCHGVPSRKVFYDYINYQNKRFFSKIKSFNFRDKSFGWNTYFESFILKNNKKIISTMYRNIFYSNYCLRPSCYNCFYTNKTRPGDISLADFWEIEKINNNFNDNMGVSCVMLNSQKAVKLFSEIDCAKYLCCDIKDCNQTNLMRPSAKPKNREEFWNVYKSKGFIKAVVSVFGKFYGLKMTLKSYIMMIRK